MDIIKHKILMFIVASAISVSSCSSVKQAEVSKDGPCPLPPAPFFGEEGNFNILLEKSVAEFRTSKTIKVIDVVPEDARGLDAINYSICKMNQLGLITNNKEMTEYVKLLSETLKKKAQ